MLGIDALEAAVHMVDSGMMEAAINDLMGRSQLNPIVEQNKKVKSLVRTKLTRWRKKTSVKISLAANSTQMKEELALYQEVIHYDEAQFEQQLTLILQKLEPCSLFYQDAKKMVQDGQAQHNPVFPYYFCQRWYESIQARFQEAQQAQLEEEKHLELDELYKRLANLENMNSVSEDIDTNAIAGRLWDMTSVNLSKSDWSVMKAQADFLKKHPKLQEIAETLGRMARESLCNMPPQLSESIHFEEDQKTESLDDIVGVHENDDLNKLLPNELLFLSHPELEVVFYKHLIDKRLMNYKMKGKSHSVKKVTSMEAMPANLEDVGPFIVCIDASGSMRGFPEQCAKAIAFALMQIALAEERDCYVIIFSTEIITYQLTKQDGLREASDFLSYTFHGGTDFEPAIYESIAQMKGEKYQHADLVIISDFIAPKQSQSLMVDVESLKSKNNRFHAICLSKHGNPDLLNIFSHVWKYTPGIGQRFIKKK